VASTRLVFPAISDKLIAKMNLFSVFPAQAGIQIR
jgi:hypothetical protein